MSDIDTTTSNASPLKGSRSIRSLLGAIAVSLALVAPAAAAGCVTYLFRGHLQDLSSTTTDPFDGAKAKVKLQTGTNASRVSLEVRGIDPATAGTLYGAHLHIGPCEGGNGAAALGHYNVSTSVPPVISAQTEVWLDFTVSGHGVGRSVARVPFVPVAGQRSVVIHALPTDPVTGAAGARLACLPVVWQ